LGLEEKEVAALQRLGLTEYEARIYISLAKMGPTKASEVSFFGNVPRTKTYGAIRELEKKNLLKIIPGKPEVYTVSSPTEVLMPLVTKLEGDVKDSTNLVHRLVLAYESNKIVRSQHPREARELWVIEGRSNINEKINELLNGASKEVNYCTSANGLIRTYKLNSNALDEARERGATIRLLTSVNNDNAAIAEEMTSVAELKLLKNSFPPQFSNFISIDEKNLLAIDANPDDLSSDRGSDTATWNQNPLSISIHNQLFNILWENSPKFDPETARPSKAA